MAYVVFLAVRSLGGLGSFALAKHREVEEEASSLSYVIGMILLRCKIKLLDFGSQTAVKFVYSINLIGCIILNAIQR